MGKLFLQKRRIYIFVVLKICLKKIQIFQYSPLLNLFLKMATLRNKRKSAAVSRETQKYPRNSQSQNSSAPGIFEEYIAKVSEEIEGRVAKQLSQDFSRTESCIFGALSKLDEFLLNSQVRTFSRTVPGTFRNMDVENQEPNGDRSQVDPHPEVEFSACRASNLTDSEPDETSHRNNSENQCMRSISCLAQTGWEELFGPGEEQVFGLIFQFLRFGLCYKIC